MRAISLVVALVAAAPASAGVMDQALWSAGTVERRGPLNVTTGLDFKRAAPGEWRVRVRCEIRDTRTGRWSARTARGVAVLSMGMVMVDVGRLGRLVLFPNGELAANTKACASGTADLGTGD
ncbi:MULTISPECIES: hypothetical protein [Methylobacteriaceae]|jgi:hypothetical protein|uniref:Uncharacterized protein n=4 Tax=Pseudomonadota TaxID=1224 RepID=A0ABU9ZK43_9HYPH|nr:MULTISPECIES: hypothetical protein [Methylobacteriaceae]MBY0141461.1 hypothetical protein [Methylorubrum populi]MCX7332278.1 hypothetical protein [Hyphomicrobiales bacterium]MBI1689946.1 hypothetical protein [Methylorubrum sp. DB1722]MBK3402615.1 hypothetical protein [Methylorubrum rhodesianum]MBY0253046.1 hypothetical protein [Methylobacterium organophilum]